MSGGDIAVPFMAEHLKATYSPNLICYESLQLQQWQQKEAYLTKADSNTILWA